MKDRWDLAGSWSGCGCAGTSVTGRTGPARRSSSRCRACPSGTATSTERVLFVAEKRAAIEAVTDSLALVDLDGLVFDLQGNKLSRRQIAEQLQHALECVGQETPPRPADLHDDPQDGRDRTDLRPVDLTPPAPGPAGHVPDAVSDAAAPYMPDSADPSCSPRAACLVAGRDALLRFSVWGDVMAAQGGRCRRSGRLPGCRTYWSGTEAVA